MERGAGRADKMNLFEVAGLSWDEGKGMMGKKSQSDAWRYLKHDEERYKRPEQHRIIDTL